MHQERSYEEPPTEQPEATVAKRCGLFNIKKKYGTMEKNRMYRAVVVQNGQYGFVHRENERMVLDHPFKTYEDAAAALNRRYRMLVGVKDPDMKPEKLVGSPS